MNLEQFLQEEINKRKMSIREFSDFIGVSHTTISRLLNNTTERKVSIDFLLKLSEKTNTDLFTLVGIVYPERTGIDAKTRILAERIAKLPPEQYQVVETLLRGFNIDIPDQSPDK